MKNIRKIIILLNVFVLTSLQYTVLAQGIYISSGGSITIVGSPSINIFNNGFINNGTYTKATETITFSGTTADTLSGSSNTDINNITITNTGGINSRLCLLTVNNLTIENGSKLTISPARNLTVTGTLANNADTAGLVFESTAAGTGSIIHSSAGVEATIQRYMANDSWHIISPSVGGQSIPLFLANVSNNVPTKGSNYGMMYYSESGGGWQYYTNPAAGTFSPGIGYLLRHTVANAVNFYGTLNAATTDVAVTQLANGWNCIGNPFQCSIGANIDATTSDNFITYNAAAFDPSYAALYVWDEPAVRVSGVSYYKLICNTGFISARPILNQAYIQPGQGFVVKANTGGATMTFTQAMRLHENTASFFKSANYSWPGIVLTASSDTIKTASTAITFNSEMTTGLDVTFDIGLLGGDPTFLLYSRLVEDNGVNFMLQSLPDNNFDSMVVPIGFDCAAGGTVTFTAETTDLPLGWDVLLEDKKSALLTNLVGISTEYTTEVDSNMLGIGRFYLHFAKQEPENTKHQQSKLVIYLANLDIIVKGEIIEESQASLYDVSGRLMRTYQLMPGNLNILPANNLLPGVYFLNINGLDINLTQKIVINIY